LELKKKKLPLVSAKAKATIEKWLRGTMERARLTKNGRFLGKGDFRDKGYLGSGGLARFRDTLWVAATSMKKVTPRVTVERLADLASASRGRVRSQLGLLNED
jgi:hypothetical protein